MTGTLQQLKSRRELVSKNVNLPVRRVQIMGCTIRPLRSLFRLRRRLICTLNRSRNLLLQLVNHQTGSFSGGLLRIRLRLRTVKPTNNGGSDNPAEPRTDQYRHHHRRRHAFRLRTGRSKAHARCNVDGINAAAIHTAGDEKNCDGSINPHVAAR